MPFHARGREFERGLEREGIGLELLKGPKRWDAASGSGGTSSERRHLVCGCHVSFHLVIH